MAGPSMRRGSGRLSNTFMKINRDIDESEKLAIELFSDLQPFTITIKDGKDGMFLASALVSEMVGNRAISQFLLKSIACNCITNPDPDVQAHGR